jgi:hypothetical protein
MTGWLLKNLLKRGLKIDNFSIWYEKDLNLVSQNRGPHKVEPHTGTLHDILS